MRELLSPGDVVQAGNIASGFRTERYAMIGDTYMNTGQASDVAEVLMAAQRASLFSIEIFPEIAIRLRLVERDYVGELGYSGSVMALAKAHVTWADICSMKS